MKRGREKFSKFKPLISVVSWIISLFPRKIRLRYFIHLRNRTGLIGIGLRYATLKTIAKSVGENVSIQPGVYLFHIENIEIGNNVSIHPMCYIDGDGGIKIGNDVSIAHSTTILSSNHIYDSYMVPIKDQGMEKRFTQICNNIWIGAKVTILGGVVINEGVVVAAGAIITKDCDSNSVYAGVPAKKIKTR